MSRNYALVTGACKDGYGQALTKKLLEEGYFVVGTYDSSSKEKAKALSESNKNVSMFCVDFDDMDSISAFVNDISGYRFGALVFAEMFYAEEDMINFDVSLWSKSIAINLSGPTFLFHKIRENLEAGSSVVFVTSIDGFKGSFNSTSYSASKAAVHNLVMSLAVNFGDKLRVNAVAAGWIESVMGDTYEPFDVDAKGFTPLKRNGKPEEVASAVLFLMSSGSSFVNGHILVVDGGYGCVDFVSRSEFLYRMKNSK